MQTKIYLSALVIMLSLFVNAGTKDVAINNTKQQKECLTVQSTPDLFELSSKWASEYNILNPQALIKIAKTSASNQANSATLSFVTKVAAGESVENKWKMILGRDVIVPVMNTANPYLNEILKQGVSAQQFANIFNSGGKQNWGAVLRFEQKDPLHIFMVNEDATKSDVAKFLHMEMIPADAISFGSSEEVISAVQKDPLAIGFCRVANILLPGTQNLVASVRLLPIDKNSNGTIDYMEDIYSDANTFLRGVWIGKYPQALVRNFYAVCEQQPTNEAELAFLSWILSDGQQYLNKAGYCELASSESQAQLDKLNTEVITEAPAPKGSMAGLIMLVLAGLVVLGVVISYVLRSYRKQGNIVPDFDDKLLSFDEASVSLPQGIYFDKSHTWAFMEKDGSVSIGIDDFLQHITGPITRVEIKDPGDKIKKGDLLFSIIQSGKQLSLYSPVSGTVRKKNELLLKDSSIVNSSPYSEGWICMIEPSNWYKELQFMEMAEKYKRWIDNEFSRVKDFMAAKLSPESLEYSHVVMQDGGVLREGVLSDFGPEVWEDFQTNFLNNYK